MSNIKDRIRRSRIIAPSMQGTVLVCIILALSIETFICNFRFWESLSFNNETILEIGSHGDGIRENSDGTYTVTDSGEASLEFTNLSCHIDNVELSLGKPDWYSTSWRDSTGPYLNYHFDVTDEGNNNYYSLPMRTYCENDSSSHWTRIHLSGKSTKFKIVFDEPSGTAISVESIKLNTVRPFAVSFTRLLLIGFVILLLRALRPGSKLYRIPLSSTSRSSIVIVLAAVTCEVAAAVFIGKVVTNGAIGEPYQNGSTVYDFNQYNHVADSLIHGQVRLNLPVSETLRDMENPYDTQERESLLLEAGETYYMDYAYYKGNYYSYFGVLPAITLFLPYKIITGSDLSTSTAVMITSLLYIICLNYLISEALRYARKGRTIGNWLLASISIVTTSGFLYLIYLPQLYSLPILMGLSLSFVGLALWMNAQHKSDSISYCHRELIAGSTCIALSLLCRPQYFLLVLLAFPVFWKGIVNRKGFFSKTGAGNTLDIIIPCLIVGSAAMLYNYARFDSPFDFGASYNLTGSDMTHRQIVLGRTIPALFQYLFQMPSISASYPFISAANMSTDFQGYWFYEPFLGGFIAFSPICLLIFGIEKPIIYKYKSTYKLCLTMIGLAIGILFLDFQIASVTTRYFNDFSWLLLISDHIMLSLENQNVGPRRISTLLVALGFCLNILALFSAGRYTPMSVYCPTMYYGLKTWLLH